MPTAPVPARSAARAFLAFALLSAAPVAGLGASARDRDAVSLDVRFELTDLAYQPIPGADVRLVFGSDRDWQSPDAGQRFTTDAHGAHRLTARVTLDARQRKRPTNFVSSLLASAEPTDHLAVAAELTYLQRRWLYVVDLERFASDGDVLLDDVSVYAADARGWFTRKARQDERGDWHMTDLPGLVLTSSGHEPWSFSLQPDPADPTGQHWTLQLAFKRAPDPVRR